MTPAAVDRVLPCGPGSRPYSDGVTKAHHHGTHTSPASIDVALDRIRGVGGRVTATKRAIVTALFAETDGVTADALVARLGSLDLTTAYRVLGQLEQAGVVEHVHLGHGPAIYRLLGDDLITVLCDTCGTTTQIPAGEFASVTARIRRTYGVALDLHHFAISGHCARGCAAPASPPHDP